MAVTVECSLMATDNVHMVLRRRMGKRLGRRVSSTAWAMADERRYVSDALDPEYPDGEDDLYRFLTDLLRVEDDALKAGLARERRRKDPGAPDAALTARIEAVSRLAADHAAGDAAVLRFRQRILHRETALTPNEAEAFLEQDQGRERAGVQRAELLVYQNARVTHDIHVWPSSPLDRLRRLAEDLARSYPWQPAQAAAFVLEGQTPLATPFLLHMPQTPAGERPARARLVMEVDLWMPAEVVARAYRKAQRDVLRGHNKPVRPRTLDVVNFVLTHRPATWAALLERWNTEHPGDEFPDYRALSWTFKRAEKSLLSPEYTLSLGPADPG
jgi:hypothetical protein